MASSRTTPSNHQSTAQAFAIRGVMFESRETVLPRSIDVVWGEFIRECSGGGVRTTTDASVALAPLLSAVKDAYNDEASFDKALFDALNTCLTTAEVCQSSTNPDCIVLQHNNMTLEKDSEQPRYARGFTRQATRKMLRFPPDYGYQINSRHDHSCAIFTIEPRRRTSLRRAVKVTPSVVEVTSAVELKTEDTNCQPFNTIETVMFDVPDLSSAHGALVQALMYTAGDVLHCRARLGLKTEGDLPLAILAGQLSKKAKRHQTSSSSAPSRRLLWVSACFNVPDHCGDPLQYSVTGSGPFPDGSVPAEEKDSMFKLALSAYLEVLLFGLQQTQDVLAGLEDESIRSITLCGRNLFFGIFDLTRCCPLKASPIPHAHLPVDGCRISQGELFAGKVNLSQVREETSGDRGVIWFDTSETSDETTDDSVLVKCTSKSFHRWLVDPSRSKEALKLVATAFPEKPNMLKGLLGVYFRSGVGMVVLMRNLTLEYSDVKPEQQTQNGKGAQLWRSFIAMVETILIPLAEQGVVHVDIRPGYDFCANLLYNVTNGDMQPIDFESLVMADEREQDPFRSRDALKFVWWQCLWMSYAWISKKSLSETYDLKKFQILYMPTAIGARSTDNFRNFFGGDWQEIQQTATKRVLSKDELLASMAVIDRVVVEKTAAPAT